MSVGAGFIAAKPNGCSPGRENLQPSSDDPSPQTLTVFSSTSLTTGTTPNPGINIGEGWKLRQIRIIVRPTIIATLLVAIAAPSVSAAPIPRSHYWTVLRASTLVKANVKIPCAKLMPNPNHLPPAASCATQPPSSIRGATITCVGRGAPLKGTRRYNRFLCRWATANQVSYGSLMVSVSGSSTFRWRVI